MRPTASGAICAVLLSGVLLVTAHVHAKPAQDPYTIVLGRADGSITASSTRRNLVDRYGEANVSDQDVDIGEGETEPGTVLFPKDSQRSIDIRWKDPQKKVSPKFLTIRGRASLWKTAHGISLGTSLKQLERINGRSFSLSGFAWDYSGTVLSWENGALEKEFVRKRTRDFKAQSGRASGNHAARHQPSGRRPSIFIRPSSDAENKSSRLRDSLGVSIKGSVFHHISSQPPSTFKLTPFTD